MLVFVFSSFSCWTVLFTVKVSKYKKKETGKKDKHTKIVIKFIWLSDYIGKKPVDEQSAFSTAPGTKLATCS